MQIATFNYQDDSKGDFHSGSKLTFHHRLTFNARTNSQKKQKQRRSFVSDLTTHSHAPLPPVKVNNQLPSSIRIKGNGITTSRKSNKISTSSFYQASRSCSRESNRSNISEARSRSITPSGKVQRTPKLVHLKFGHPIKIRSSDFYASNLSEAELRLREESFVNDSIRSANLRSHSLLIPCYEPLDDPDLKKFFQSPLVLDVVRKTLDIDLRERSSQVKRRSKTNDRHDDYLRIVAKKSSGYSRLNGYDCIPSYAPARDRRSRTYDKYRSSTNSSLTSFPTHSSMQFQQKRSSRQSNKPKFLAPTATPSPLRHRNETISDIAQRSSVSQE